MKIETYDELLEQTMNDTAIAEAEAELRENGTLYDARERLVALRGKHLKQQRSSMVAEKTR